MSRHRTSRLVFQPSCIYIYIGAYTRPTFLMIVKLIHLSHRNPDMKTETTACKRYRLNIRSRRTWHAVYHLMPAKSKHLDIFWKDKEHRMGRKCIFPDGIIIRHEYNQQGTIRKTILRGRSRQKQCDNMLKNKRLVYCIALSVHRINNLSQVETTKNGQSMFTINGKEKVSYKKAVSFSQM